MLTVHQQPQELTPAYNKQIFVALSDEIAQTDFKYIVTVTVNGDTAHSHVEEPALYPTTGHIVFDAKNWVENYIEHYFNPAISLLSPIEIATNKSVNVEVTIEEYYTASVQSTTTIEYVAFDACLTDRDFRNYDFSDFIFNGTSGLFYLSKTIFSIFPDTRAVVGQDVWFHFINNPAQLIDSIIIELRRSNVTIDSVTIGSLPAPVGAYDTYVLNGNSNMFTVATAQSGDVVRIKYYAGAFEVLRHSYSLTAIETDFTPYTLYYLDRTGNIPFFHFEKLSTKNHSKKTSKVKLSKDRLNTTTHQFGSNEYDREEHVVNTAIESTITLNTNWIESEQSTYLKDCWDSPIHYLEDTESLRAVSLTDAPYEEKVEGMDPLFNYSVTVDLGITETRQRGI
jgi:hypothetical protein